jgi:hypothetical protein
VCNFALPLQMLRLVVQGQLQAKLTSLTRTKNEQAEILAFQDMEREMALEALAEYDDVRSCK